ncbi:TPA: MFS transporter [Candidatus Poribacteria bacterium]|nr:MFS transporter [Candidatus Poribacteria bacterium]
MKNRSNGIRIALLALAHGVTDSYGNFLAALSLPLKNKLGISNAQLGGLVSVQSIASSMSQIGFGYLSDRFGRGIFVTVAPAVTAIFMSFIGLAPNYLTLAMLLLIGGFGVASLHPQGAATAGKLSQERRGLGVSIFSFGGSVGFASGPLIITSIVAVFGMKGTPLAVVSGVAMSIVLFFTIYGKPFMSPMTKRERMGLIEALRPHLKIMLLLLGIVVFRAATSIIFTNFLRVLKSEYTGITGGFVLFIYLASGSIGGVIGGYLSDRISRKSILIFSLFAATPFLWAVVHSSGIIFFICLFFSGFILSSSTPINIVMAQEMLPSNASIGSSFMMGLGWGIGGLLSIPFGALADINMVAAMSGMSLIPMFTTVFAIMLPGDPKRKIFD